MLFRTGLLICLGCTYPLAVFAQPFRESENIPPGTSIEIDGSSSLATVNLGLKQAFEGKYPNTKVNLQYRGTKAALQALEAGEIDIAAIGRPLSEAEKVRGLKTIALPRRKIAIVVSPDNPFTGNLTDRQFAGIFRGEITDWSDLGGEKGGIRLIDRPLGDTRQSFANYPAFQTKPLETGSNAVTVPEDSTSAITRELGKDGISYTIADQALNNPNLRVLKMFDTPVTDARYPFSSPSYLVYKDATRLGVSYFLGFVNTPIGQKALETAPPSLETALSAGEAVISSSPSPTPSVIADAETIPTATETKGLPLWLWGLLPLALLAGLGLWAKNRRLTDEPALPQPIIAPPPIIPHQPLVTLPRNPEPDTILDLPETLANPDLDTLPRNPEPDTILDLPETLADPDLDTEPMFTRDIVPDHPFPSTNITKDTVPDHPFPSANITKDTVPDHPFPSADLPNTSDDTVLDLPAFSENEENRSIPSGFPSGVVPLAAISALGAGMALGSPSETPVSSYRQLLTVNSRSNCYELDDRQLLDLESQSNCFPLEIGTYRIKISQGFFHYGSDTSNLEGEPFVLLWIFGGRFINLQTGIEVQQTWRSLNGYEDTLILRVLEPTHLCGLFFDTYALDNQGQIVLSITKEERD